MFARLSAAGLVFAGLLSLPAPARAIDDPTFLVSTRWLADHLGDPSLVVLHVGPKDEYEKTHVPGARYLSFEAFAAHRDGLSLQLPAVERLDSVFESLGVSDDSRIVLIYGGRWITPTARAYLTLDYLGLGGQTSILDGGLQAWVAEGRPVTAETPTPARGSLRPRPREVVADVDWVRGHLDAAEVAILDARTANYYDGTDAGSMPRAGHLPGAQNVPYTSIVDDSLRFHDAATLRERFEAAGVQAGQLVITYCHIGQQASLVYFVAKMLGFDARLYDGSFQEWSRREDLPVEAPPGAGLPKLIDTETLAERLERGWNLTVIDARSDLADYLRGHIEGAVFLHNETLRAAEGGIPAALLPGEAYASLFSRLGVRRDGPVVVYGTGEAQNFHATFVVWLLRGFGHPQVYLLDGGYDKWAAEGRAIARAYPRITPSDFGDVEFRPDVASLDDVRAALDRPDAILVDARPLDQYTGRAGAQIRRGHIPGAVDHFWHGDLVRGEGGAVFRPADDLRTAYEAQGITPEKDVIVYCNTGTEASHLYFVLHDLLKYPRVRVYVPSWTEWSAREDLPIATGER